MFVFMSLYSCHDDDRAYTLCRDVSIHNATSNYISYYGLILKSDSTGVPLPFVGAELAPFNKRVIRENWPVYSLMSDISIFLRVTIEKNEYGIRYQEPLVRYYKIKCSELEEKYNTIIIYDDDDTTKW